MHMTEIRNWCYWKAYILLYCNLRAKGVHMIRFTRILLFQPTWVVLAFQIYHTPIRKQGALLWNDVIRKSVIPILAYFVIYCTCNIVECEMFTILILHGQFSKVVIILKYCPKQLICCRIVNSIDYVTLIVCSYFMQEDTDCNFLNTCMALSHTTDNEIIVLYWQLIW